MSGFKWFKRYVRYQLMTFAFGAVGPIFLVIFFAAQPDPTIKWMYWWGLFITAADVLVALALTGDGSPADPGAERPGPRG